MAYTLANLENDIRNYTEVDSTVFSSAILNPIIKNAENKIYREVDSDEERHYATSNAIIGNRYVTIPADLRFIRYVQLTNTQGDQFYLEQRDTSFMAEYYATPSTQAVGIPRYYGNWDTEFWVIAPTPDKTYEITLAYNKEPVSITDTTSTTAPGYKWNLFVKQISRFTFVWLSGKCIWILERTSRYDTIL